MDNLADLFGFGGLTLLAICWIMAWRSSYNGDHWFVAGLLLAGVGVGFAAAIAAGDEEKHEAARMAALMQQCLEDGKKEYECVAMLRSGKTQVVPVPIVVPVR